MPTVKYKDRPTCETKGCCNPVAIVKDYYDGWANYRRWCGSCHSKRTAKKHGLKNLKQVVAKNAGMTVADYTNQFHPYRKHRKDYCENIDSRLGYKCTTTIVIAAQLEVDHIDGNPSNNNPGNLQTLCACCHKYKTLTNEDYATPGRLALGITY
jgi:hypothetical protein